MEIMIVYSWNASYYNFYVEKNVALYNLDACIKQTQSVIVIFINCSDIMPC